MAVFTRRRFYFVLFSLALIFGFAGGLVYWQLRDLENLKGLVAEQLETLTQRDVSIAWAELDWSEGIGVRLHKVALIDRASSKTVFAADSVGATIGVWSLLKQKAQVDRLRLEGARFQITRTEAGRVVLEGLGSSLPVSGSGASEWRDPWRRVRRLDLLDSTLLFVDHSLGKDPVTLEARRVHVSLSQAMLKPLVLFSVEGELTGSTDRVAPFRITGRLRADAAEAEGPLLKGKLHLEGGYLPWFAAYLDRVFAFAPQERWVSAETDFFGDPKTSLTLQGHLDLSQRLPEAQPALTALPPHAEGAIDFDMTLAPEEIRFDRLDYRAGTFQFQAKGRYSGFGTDRPRVALQVTSTAFAVENSAGYLPFKLFHNPTHEEFHKRFRRGRMEIRSLSFDGTLDQLNHLSAPENLKRLNAELVLHGVDFGARLPGLKGVRGKLIVKPGGHRVNISKAHYADFSISSLSGEVTGVMDRPIVDWTVEGRFDLSELKKTLKRVMDTRSFESQMNLFQDLQGAGQARLHFTGPLDDPKLLVVEGTMQLENASFQQAHLKQPFEKVKGTIRFTNRPEIPGVEAKNGVLPWEVKFEGFSGKLGTHEITDLAAETTLEKGDPVQRVYGKVKLGLLEAAELVSGPLLGRFESVLKDVTFTGGEVLLDFRSKGAQLALEPKGPLGLVRLNKVTLQHKAGYRPLINVSGYLYFDKDKIRLETSEAWYGDSPVEIKGQYLNFKSKNPELVLRASSSEFKPTDFTDIPFLETLNYQGPAKVEFVWQSNDQYQKFENHVDLTRAAYQYGDWLVKPAGAANTILAKGQVLPAGGLDIKELVYELEGNRLTGHARVERPADPWFSAHLESAKFNTLSAAPYVVALASNRGGELEFSIDGKGPVRRLERAEHRGKAQLRQLEFKPDGFVKPFTLNAEVQWTGNQVKIASGRLASEKTRTRFDGSYVAGPVPRLKLKLEGDTLLLNELLPEPGNEPENATPAWWRTSKLLNQGTGAVELNLKEFQYKFWTLNRLASNFSFQDQLIRIDRFSVGRERRDQILGQGTLSLKDPDGVGFEGLILARAVQADGFLGAFGPLFENGLTGQLKWFKAKLKSRGASLRQVFQNLEGDVAFDLDKGTIQTARLRDGLRRLFQFPGKIKPEALQAEPGPYLDILGDFSVRGGVARTENFRFEDPDRRMSLVGDFDLGHFQMDTVVGIAPLRELDRFLTKIPLVGKIITAGDEESLVKNYYTVKGGFSDPEISPIPFTALGKKVVGIFQGILQSPAALFPSPDTAGK